MRELNKGARAGKDWAGGGGLHKGSEARGTTREDLGSQCLRTPLSMQEPFSSQAIEDIY